MPISVNRPELKQAHESLRAAGPRGKELADLLDERGTRVWVVSWLYGGFTLNFLNSIFVMPLRPNADDWDYKAWVSLLGHEASHVQQRYWIDSIQQEIIAYRTQVVVGDELGINLQSYRDAFANLDPNSRQHQRLAQAALLGLFAGTPAGIVYASLPLWQPRGLDAVAPGFKEGFAAVRAAFALPRT